MPSHHLPCPLAVLTHPPAPGSRRITELALLVEMYQERGTKVEFVDEAVWIANTTLTFYVDDDAENADHGSRYPHCILAQACAAPVLVVNSSAACSRTTPWCTRTAFGSTSRP